MSDDNNQGSGGGQSLSGGANEPLPSTWSRPSQAPRVGRIGNWSNSPSTGGSQRIGRIGGSSGSSPGPSRDGDDDEGDDDDDDDKRETWFTGGERSGLSVQNPGSAQRMPGGDMVRDLLRRAAEGGHAPPPPTSNVFRGSGHTLGSEDVPSSVVPDPSTSNNTVIRHITFWRNGFTIENGELMRYDDPNNAQILSQIHAGNAPPSLLNVEVGQEVEVQVDKRIGEDYVEPKGVKTFTGSGQRLGAPVPSVAAEGGSAAMPGSFPSPDAPAVSLSPRESITTRFEVDQSLPTTSVQIRLADGTRMVCRMNLTHKVLDLRHFINASRPENLTRPYTIGTTFPNRTLDDDSATIEGAGLVNSVVVQRWV